MSAAAARCAVLGLGQPGALELGLPYLAGAPVAPKRYDFTAALLYAAGAEGGSTFAAGAPVGLLYAAGASRGSLTTE